MYAYAVTALVAASLAFGAAWKTQNWRYASKELERQRVEARDQVKKIERGDEAATKHEGFKAKEEVRYVTRTKEVERIVERPVYRNICIDADGLRILNDEIAGREPASEPAPAVPGPAATR